MQILVKLAINKACGAAAANESAADFAERYYEDIPEPMLLDLCSAPDWFERLAQGFPMVAAHRPWFESLRAKFIEFATEDGLLTPPAAPDTTGLAGKGEGDMTQKADNGTVARASVPDSGTKPDA